MNPLILWAAIALCSFVTGWTANGWRLNSKHNEAVAEQQVAANKHLVRLQDEHDVKADKQNKIAEEELAKLRKAKDETNRYRACLANGTCGMRVQVTCPATGGAETGQGGHLDTGTGAELTGPAQQAYTALREGISSAEAKLTACQNTLRLYQ